MNQREDTQGNEHVQRGREANGGRDYHPGSHGFDETTHDRSYSQDAARHDRERWNNGFERQQHRTNWRGAGGDANRGYGGGGGQYGPRAYRADRPAAQDRDGFGQHAHWNDPLYGRQQPFGPPEDTHYYGTGSVGYGGPGFTGGAYAYGNGPRDQGRPIEDEYSDESAVSYEHRPRQPYGQRYGQQSRQQPYGETRTRRFTTGPKGYQRSDERLKEDICERLMEAHYIDSSDVSVEVTGAKVMLDGTVPSRYMKHGIEDIVDACPGVQDIDNRVRVANPMTRQGQGGQSQSQSLTGGGITPNGTNTPTDPKSR